MSKLIGTAGHVDHGKTSLIRALTGIDADRLPEEKRRGLTIDVGFAYLDLPGVGRVSIVDVPGHERFIANMLVGALGVHVALLCVAADESVMPQTREHLQILNLLPVERLVVALTRADLADDVSREVARDETRELLATTRFRDCPIVAVSSVTGEGLEALKQELGQALEAAAEDLSQAWYLPIDRVFTVKGHGTVVTGPMMQGRVREGEEAQVEPGGLTFRIRQIQGHDASVDEAHKGQRTALNLSGPKSENLARGMVAGRPGTVFETTVLDLKLDWTEVPKHGQRARLSIGADEVIGKIFLSDQDSSIAQFRAERSLAAVKGQPVILRSYSPQHVLAGGVVAVPLAGKRRKSGALTLSAASDPAAGIESVLHEREEGVTTEEVCRAVGRSPQALGETFESLARSGRALGFAGLWFSPAAFELAAERFLKALDEVHELQPARLLVTKEAVTAHARLPWRGKPLDRIVSRLESLGLVRTSGSGIGLEGRAAVLTPSQRSLLDKVKALLVAAGVNVPDPKSAALALGVPFQAVEGILRVGSDAGEVVRVAEGVWYVKGSLEDFLARAESALQGREFSAGEFKDALGTSRKFAIPLLEYADSKGRTLRRGDVRVFVRRESPGPPEA